MIRPYQDEITILYCSDIDCVATKTFDAMPDGTIVKSDYNAGMRFNFSVKNVKSLNDLYDVIKIEQQNPRALLVRGETSAQTGTEIYRRMNGQGATFTSKPRHWVMIDFDKVSYPEHLDILSDPESVIKWLIGYLPTEFMDVSCIFQFSSSQNVSLRNGETPERKVSAHLFFWGNERSTEEEWRRLFTGDRYPVDEKIYSVVQPHFIATPIFINMTDPLTQRFGMILGSKDTFDLPDFPVLLAKNRQFKRARKSPSVVSEASRNEALKLAKDVYPVSGNRNRFCGAVAGTLYRGGWIPEDVSEFVLELAHSANDDEAMSRHDSALNICLAIERGDKAQGIPVLKTEFLFERLPEFIALLDIGIAKPDDAINSLSPSSTIETIEEIISSLKSLKIAEKDHYLERIKSHTGKSMGTLRKMLKEAEKSDDDEEANDLSLQLANLLLELEFSCGRHLIKTNGSFYKYNGRHWEIAEEDLLRNKLLMLIPQLASDTGNTAATIDNALRILTASVYRNDDPLRFMLQPMPIINCRNGELWYLENAEVSFRPHSPESFLRASLDVDYNPLVLSPKFDKALSEIFSNSINPQELTRHFCEYMGYLCQPWRKIAIIMLFYGRGSNGKTKLAEIIQQMIGPSGVVSDRIGDIEKNAFKIGNLLGKNLLIDDDVDARSLLPDGLLKKISEEKVMTGEQKYKDPFNFISRASPLLLANEYPATKDISFGLRRRMSVIPFARQFEPNEKNADLFNVIWDEEKSGILNHAIKGFQRLKCRGKFDEPLDCKKAKDDWINSSNTLAAFVDEACRTCVNSKQAVSEAYLHYKLYCGENGIRSPLELKNFKIGIEKLGYSITTGSAGKKHIVGFKSEYLSEVLNSGQLKK